MGAPFFQAIDNITAASNGTQMQEASFFCFEGSSWVILGMDTGITDDQVSMVGKDIPFLLNQTSWAVDKIKKAKAAGKRVFFSSHHQFFTQNSIIGVVNGSDPALNPTLQSELEDVLADIDVWFWGHEHNYQPFTPYAGLARGRLLGSSGITSITSMNMSNPNPSLTPPEGETSPPVYLSGSPTSMPVASFATYYQKQFAIMTMTGLNATIDYYTM